MDTILKYFKPEPEKVDALAENLDCSRILAALLTGRGITTIDNARFFLNPDFNNLADPFLLKDMDKAVRRIFTAVKNREKILIFGDFDADGITSTALLSEFLEYCNADISWYIPHRDKEGYSLQLNHIQMAADRDIDLIITVDCGVTSFEAVTRAKLEDIDVIITDHHEPDKNLPDSIAVINPKREECKAGLEYLAGVGVVFFLVMALRKFFRDNRFWEELPEPNLLNYLDLFAIGTIGDMVPLVHANRVLSIAGLKKIRQGTREGLRSIAGVCRLDVKKIDSDDISFKIVPRINAAGRISHARICVSQLMTTDVTAARKTASILDKLNIERQRIEQEIVDEIENRILKNQEIVKKNILFLWSDKWNPGVLGIAASKLSKKYCRPVILLSINKNHAVGSGRSVNNINIHKALQEHQSLLVKSGGHAMACGLTVKSENLDTLGKNLNSYLEKKHSSQDFQNTKFIDAVLDFEEIHFDLAKEIDQLRPFGVDNKEPVFLCRNIIVTSSYMIAGRHRKMLLSNNISPGSAQIEAFHFNIDNPEKLPDYYSEIAFKLKINKFKKKSPQIIIEQL